MGDPYLRIIDANFNRAKEALRISEDISRFLIEDKGLTQRFKRCRHDLTDILLSFPVSYKRLVNSRSAQADIGKTSWIQDGKKKPDWKAIMIANMKRSQEASRVLEEFGKVLAPKSVKALQRLRFKLYDLEKRSFQKL